MLSRIALALCLAGLATPSLATEWLNCAAPDGGASIDLLLGAGEVIAVAGFTVTTGDKVWASDPAYGPGEPAMLGQAFEDANSIRIDVLDGDFNARIAELRLFKAEEGEAPFVYGGTLRLPGHGAWPVACADS